MSVLAVRGRGQLAGAVAFAVAAMLVPLAPVFGRYEQFSLMMVFLYVAMSSAWNLLGGYAGQPSAGFTVFYGIGAYAAIALYNAGWSWLVLAMVVGGVLSAVASVVIGYPTFRLRGPFFFVTTLALAEAVRIAALNAPFLGAASGLAIEARVEVSLVLYYELSVVLAAVSVILTMLLRGTQLGLGLIALRDDPDAAEAIGIDTLRYKLIAHGLAAFIVGLCGVVSARYLLYAEPRSMFGFELSVALILITVVGGIGTPWGPVIGALIFIMLRDYVSSAFAGGNMHLIVFGVVLVLIVQFEPQGVVGLLNRLRRVVVRRAWRPVRAADGRELHEPSRS
jgi:branched-chain amino acid transport system permease protein